MSKTIDDRIADLEARIDRARAVKRVHEWIYERPTNRDIAREYGCTPQYVSGCLNGVHPFNEKFIEACVRAGVPRHLFDQEESA